MTSPASLFDDLLAAGLSPQRDAPLAPRTWWQIGGPAEILVKAGTVAEVQAVARAAAAHGAPVFVLGNGTNLLVSDRGIPGIVLQLHRDLATAEADDDGPTPRIVAGAGTKLVVLLKKALRHGWTGLEVFAGIPGTVGGAVRMNAGARLGETARVLESVDLVLPEEKRGGLGIRIGEHGDGIKVRAVLPGSPAEELGLRAGDVITALGRESVAGWTTSDFAARMIGDVGSEQRFTVRRADGTEEQLLFERRFLDR